MGIKTYELKSNLGFYEEHFEEQFLSRSREHYGEEILKYDFTQIQKVVVRVHEM